MAKLSFRGAKGVLNNLARVDGADGAFIMANNVIIRHPNLIEPRWGLQMASSSVGTDRAAYDWVNKQSLWFNSMVSKKLYKYNGTSTTSLDTSYYYSDSVASRNFTYLLSDTGLRRINAGNTATEIGYVPEALDMTVAVNAAAGWMANNTQAGYCYVIGIKNSNTEYFLGAPSGRYVVINSSGATRDVNIEFTIPADITTNHFYQVYRTDYSSGVGVDPGNNFYLIYEDYFAATSGTVTITDRVPQGGGGQALYTNASQQGIAQANYPCECATGSLGQGNLSSFANCVFASNYKPRSSLTFALMSVESTYGVQYYTNPGVFTGDRTSGSNVLSTIVGGMTRLAVGMAIEGTGIPAGTTITAFDTGAFTITMSANASSGAATTTDLTIRDQIVIAGTTYQASNTEDIPNKRFAVGTSGTTSRDIRTTAESLVRVINRYSGNTVVYAQYLSGPDDLPGIIRVWGRTDRASTYTVQAKGHTTAWSGGIGTATTILSKSDPGLSQYSKPNEPQAFPRAETANSVKMPENATIIEMVALRGALLYFTDRGLYRLTGYYGNFSLDLIDRTCILLTTSVYNGMGVTVVDNVAYGITNKGLVAASETGVEVLPYQPTQLISPTLPSTASRIMSDFNDGLVIFTVGSNAIFCYNTQNNTWSNFTFSDTTGTAIGTYYCGTYDYTLAKSLFNLNNTLVKVRNSDFQAETLYDSITSVSDTILITGATATTLTLSTTVALPSAGDYVLTDLGTEHLVVSASNVAGHTVIVVDNASSVVGNTPTNGEIRRGYDCYVKYFPRGDVSPTITKNLRYANVVFDGAPTAPDDPLTFDLALRTGTSTGRTKRVTAKFATDIDSTENASTTVVCQSTTYPHLCRVIVPTAAARCSVVCPTVLWRTAGQAVRLVGIDIDYEPVSDKTRI